jgi:hypothetical protein
VCVISCVYVCMCAYALAPTRGVNSGLGEPTAQAMLFTLLIV